MTLAYIIFGLAVSVTLCKIGWSLIKGVREGVKESRKS